MEAKPELSWSELEDEVLVAIVSGVGAKRWNAVLHEFRQVFPGTTKTYKQCRERWFNHANPTIRKGPYSPEEKQEVYKLHQQYGNRWNLIARAMTGRSDSSIKTFFYAEIKKVLRNYNRSHPRNRVMRTLRSLVRDHGTTVFFQLAEPIAEPLEDDHSRLTQSAQEPSPAGDPSRSQQCIFLAYNYQQCLSSLAQLLHWQISHFIYQ